MTSFTSERSIRYLLWTAPFLGLYVVSRHNYLLFHSLAEIFSVIIACGIFMVTWNCRRFLDNHYLLFLGITYLFVGSIDFIHTLAYRDMGVFPGGGANLPTQLWISARYLQSISFLIAPFFLKRNVRINAVFAGYLLVTTLLVVSIFFWHIFPDCFVEGTGLTPFKKVSEYVISFILLAAIGFLLKNHREFERHVLRLLVFSIAISIAGELAFTFYVSVYGISNLIGHFFKIISFYLVYKAIIETGLVRPYGLLFANLKQSEEKFRGLYSAMNEGVALHEIIYDQAGKAVDYRVIDSNPAYEPLLGIKREDALNSKASELYGSGEPPYLDTFAEVAATGEPVLFDSYFPAMDKYFSISVFSPEKGKFATVFSDITDRKHAEEQINSLAKFPSENPNPVLRIAHNGTILFANQAGRDLLDVWEKQEDFPVPAAWHKFALEATVLNVKKKMELECGNRWYSMVFAPIEGTDYVNLYGLDITERKQAEESFKEREATLRSIVMAAPVGIGLTNNRVFSWVSDQMCAMVGYSQDELVGKNARLLYPNDGEFERVGQERNRKEIFPGIGEIETRWKCKNGEVIDVLVRSAFIYPSGQLGDRIFTAVDITDRKRDKEALQKAHDELEKRVAERTAELRLIHDQLLHSEKLSAIGKLSASIAHEVNNPLFGIRNVLGGISRRAPLEKDDAELVDMALQECDRIKYLIQDLQDFNRPTSGIMAPMDVHKTIKSTLLLLQKEFKNQKIKVEKRFAENIPYIRAVADQIKQVLLNLLNNAGEALSGKGGIITITTEVLDDKVAIHIQDTGVGIKSDDMSHIFEPFFTTKPEVKGTGLGLAVSYGIVKRHGGKIEVASEPGKGSIFSIILPIDGKSR